MPPAPQANSHRATFTQSHTHTPRHTTNPDTQHTAERQVARVQRPMRGLLGSKPYWGYYGRRQQHDQLQRRQRITNSGGSKRSLTPVARYTTAQADRAGARQRRPQPAGRHSSIDDESTPSHSDCDEAIATTTPDNDCWTTQSPSRQGVVTLRQQTISLIAATALPHHAVATPTAIVPM